MDRLARLRTRSSAGGPLNASTTSSLAAGYETANDESITSGCSMYFSMTEGGGGGDGTKNDVVEDEIALEEEPTLSGTLATTGSGVDQTLENDFSVEEVSTIRKATIAHASPATVQVASGMTVKYLGVSSTPAPKTPAAAAAKKDLSGFEQLDQTPSIMKKMRDPKTPAECSFGDDPEESKVTLDGSGVQGALLPGNKSYGTNVLANFFASLDVNPGTPVPPEIKVSAPEETAKEPVADGATPNKRESNSCENFFESLKKTAAPEAEKENKRRKSLATGVRKSLIPKVASILATAKENRVASPISRKPPTTVKLLPDKLREMRKTNNEQLVSFRRKTIVPAATVTLKKSDELLGVPAKVNTGLRKSMAVATAAVRATTAPAANGLKRKSVAPTTTTTAVAAVNARKSVLPAPGIRRSVVTATAAPSRVALKVPAKTTLASIPDSTSTASTRRTILGKRPATTLTATLSLPEKTTTPTTATDPPQAKQRKSLAPVKESSPAIRVSPRTKSKPVLPAPSRIRPPTAAAGFKKPETFTCDQCQRIFRFKSSYETHLKTGHQAATTNGHNKSTEGTSATPANKCQYCGKGFAGAKFLENHIASNCVKIPLLEKRRLLAEAEQQRAANLKRTPENAAKKRMSLRPPSSSSSTGSVNRSNSSTRSGDETDTSTCSSNGGKGGTGGPVGPRKATTGAGRGGGISRTPNKELKCHLCARRFLNAVEYALHVQAHAQNLKTGGGGDGKDVEEADQKEQQMGEDVTKLVQKLVTLKNRNGGTKVVAKSSNGHVGK